MTEEAHCGEAENEQHEADGDKLRNCSTHIHRFEGLTKRIARVEGRAKSPVLSARAVAAVKIADCVSWLTLRADARFRWALTISG
jgi:hypothetical protein